MVSGSTEIVTLNQYLSLKNAGVTFEGQSYLFWEYVRILNEVNPDYYLLENVVMAKKWENVITSALGLEPVKINSNLVSAQNRPRLYWTNIKVTVPQDENIVIDDILDTNADASDVSYCQTVQRSFKKLEAKYGYIPERFNAYNVTELKNKACALSRGSMVTSSCATLMLIEAVNGQHTVVHGVMDGKYKVRVQDGLYNIRKLSAIEIERLQNLPDGYTNVNNIGYSKRSQMIGNGWTVDVISHILSCM